MQELIVGSNEAGQRLTKLLEKYLPEAPKSFYYKMLRKKNITLNGKKAAGNEMLVQGDMVKLFLSDETIRKFQKAVPEEQAQSLPDRLRPSVIWEGEHVLFFQKPAGLLSQKAEPNDLSLVDYLIEYLLREGALKQQDLQLFRPGICNRLDRNTSGLVAAGKTLAGLQAMNQLFHDRTMDKYYLALVTGRMEQAAEVTAWLGKDETANQVTVSDQEQEGMVLIRTAYEPLAIGTHTTLLKVKLITGRSHQIRAHLAWLGHPIVGDTKYGSAAVNQRFRQQFGLRYQMLHAWQLQMPTLCGPLQEISDAFVEAPLPEMWRIILQEEKINGNLEFQRIAGQCTGGTAEFHK